MWKFIVGTLKRAARPFMRVGEVTGRRVKLNAKHVPHPREVSPGEGGGTERTVRQDPCLWLPLTHSCPDSPRLLRGPALHT